MPSISRYFPFLRWPRPDAALLRSEAVAGLTVGLMVIPQGVAYAGLAGMPLVTGIYASMLPALVAVLFGASQRLSVGPTALSCLLVSASLAGLAQPSSSEWVSLAVWLALLSGFLQVMLGVVRFGWLLAQSINSIDATGVETFARLRSQLALQKRELWIVGVKLPVETVLNNAGLLSSADSFRWISSDRELLSALGSKQENTGN